MTDYKIVRGIRTPKGRPFTMISGPTGSLWISLLNLSRDQQSSFEKISMATGILFLTPAARNQFLNEVSTFDDFGTAAVVDTTGWNTGHVYGFFDGSSIGPGANETVTVLPSNERFKPCGSLELWQKSMTPYVQSSTPLFFALGVALAGPLLRFMPPSVANIFVEFFGESQSGKTTLAIAAGTTFSGSPNDSIGTALTWNMTPGGFEEQRRRFSDGFMVLDEAESMSNIETRRELVKSVIMTSSSSRSRIRQGDADEAPIRAAYLSTSNQPLADILGGHAESRRAALSRVLSVEIGQNGLKAWNKLPPGCSSEVEAVHGLRAAMNKAYGWASRAFISEIATRAAANKAKFRGMLQDLFQETLAKLDVLPLEARQKEMLATIVVTMRLARRWSIFPKDWGRPHRAVKLLFPASRVTGSAEADAFINLALSNQNVFALGGKQTEATRILYVEERVGERLLIVDKQWLRANLPNHLAKLRAARSAGILRTNSKGTGQRLDYRPPATWKVGKKSTAFAIMLNAGDAERLRAADRARSSRNRP